MKHERTPPISCMVQFSSSNDYLATYYMWTTKLLLNNVRIGPILSLQEAITITTDSTTSVRRGLLLHRFKTSAPTKENYKDIIDIYDNASTVSKSLTMTSWISINISCVNVTTCLRKGTRTRKFQLHKITIGRKMTVELYVSSLTMLYKQKLLPIYTHW